MLIGRRLLSLPFHWPRASIAGLLPLLWFVWLLWPPQPDFCFEKPAGSEGVISADGSRVVFLPNQTKTVFANIEPKKYHFTTVDVRSLVECRTTGSATAIPVLLSPDGRWIALRQPNYQWDLHSLVSPSEPLALPPGRWTRVRWSVDGCHLIAANGVATVVLRTSDGRPVFQSREVGACAEVLPDGSGLFAVSRDERGIELWDFKTGAVIEQYPLKLPNSSNNPRGLPRLPDPSISVHRICVSRDGQTIVALVKSDDIEMLSLSRENQIQAWKRSTREQRTFPIDNDSFSDSFYLEVSDDGRVASFNLLESPFGRDNAIPQCFVPPSSKRSLWTTWDLSAGERRPGKHAPPIKLSVEWQGRVFLKDSTNVVRVLDTKSGHELHRITAEWSSYRGGRLSKDHAVFQVTGSGWNKSIRTALPAVLANLLMPVSNIVTETFRVSDGKTTRILHGRWPIGFDCDGQLWTEMSDTNRYLWERWSPEAPRPWWLYAVTAAGVGYLIWPALVRLASRWRRTCPAGIAA
ncbi:MAG: hypothetical protein K1X57_03040 [Gemmataceae bacterium]|nr:hypothetical protein [Gemmataceae bacterium]